MSDKDMPGIGTTPAAITSPIGGESVVGNLQVCGDKKRVTQKTAFHSLRKAVEVRG